MMIFKRLHNSAVSKILLLALFVGASSSVFTGCTDLFGDKENNQTDDIFEEGRIDPKDAEDVVGYAAITPFWGGFSNPKDVFVGYDELVYVVDDNGLHVLDRAGRLYETFDFIENAESVVQDRLLNVYVTARRDTIIQELDPNLTWNLPVVYKLENANGAGQFRVADIVWHPFDDASRSTTTAQRSRLKKDLPDNDEMVSFTGVTVLSDNTVYVARTGPRNNTNTLEAPDNVILEYSQSKVDGEWQDGLTNVSQMRSLSPTRASLLSSIDVSGISSFVAPPQRESMSDSRSFLLCQTAQGETIPFRVLQINVIETSDGLSFQPNASMLNTDTTEANGFLYSIDKFDNPTDVAFAADGTNYIFVTDSGTDSLYLFQSNGYEGVNPPAGSNATKPIIVSFGGEGSGPKQFNDPSGVAYFREVLYIADTKNNRICRYKLTTDFE